jgi:hypothetical protein
MKIKTKLIKNIKVGDIIVLDCGYQCASDYIDCKVLSINNNAGLFGDKQVAFKVKRLDYTNEIFYTCGFDPEQKLDIK